MCVNDIVPCIVVVRLDVQRGPPAEVANGSLGISYAVIHVGIEICPVRSVATVTGVAKIDFRCRR